MIPLFLGSFLAGLILTVVSMLVGVERRGGVVPRAEPGERPRVRLTRPIIAAFAMLFGVLGYLLERHTTLGPVSTLVLAAVAGGLGILGSVLLVAKWAVKGAHDDTAELLQGHVATVTRDATDSAPAEITYVLNGARSVVPAKPVDDTRLVTGAEVVIERIENGIAYVEAWAQVEQRL
jgi:hypothetical protein